MVAHYTPMVFNEYMMTSEKDVEHLMQHFKQVDKPIMVQFHNVVDVTKVIFDYVGEHFVKGHHTITGLAGNSYQIPVTIPYSDVLSNEVHIITEEGKIERK